MSSPRLFVTTARRRSSANEARADEVARRTGGERIARADLPAAQEAHPEALTYVVSRRRDEVRDASGAALFVHPGLLASRLVHKKAPILDAVSGGEPIAHVVDLTLGLAGDALLLAAATGAQVVGVEGTAITACLLEEGLARLAAQTGRPWAEAAARIEVLEGRAEDIAPTLASASADVVYLDPMMPYPQKGQPGFALLRAFAVDAQPDAALLAHAARIARRRVVCKLRRGTRRPPQDMVWHRTLRSWSFDFLIHDVGGGDGTGEEGGAS